jgi:hypothetical protein
VVLHLTDGGPGDLDGVVNGIIVDPSGPDALATEQTDPDDDTDTDPDDGSATGGSGGGGGGGGCFITTAAGSGDGLLFPAVLLILCLAASVLTLLSKRKPVF